MNVNKNKIPKFENEEQEAEYWDTHSPLDINAEPELQKVKVSGLKDKPIAIRLDSETRIKLDRLAAKQGVGPSTMARIILTQAIESKNSLRTSPDMNVLMSVFESNLARADKDKIDSFVKDISIGDPDNPALLIFSGQRKNWEEVASIFLKQLLALLDINVITLESKNYDEFKEIIRPRIPKAAYFGVKEPPFRSKSAGLSE
jgi:hypothetical protein